MMKKLIYIILSVMILGLMGCKSGEEHGEIMEEEVIETIASGEGEINEDLQEDDVDVVVEETETTEKNMSSDNTGDSKTEEHTKKIGQENEEPTAEVQQSNTSNVGKENNNQEVDEQKPTSGQEVQDQIQSYNPQRVVSLATDKVKSQGKITLTDNLDRLLAEGTITQEEYETYYPYDGAGYYSVFMEVDLNDAQTTSGRKLGSEEEIAQYIADMLVMETVPYFLIEYAGVYTTGGNNFYEFRCYRA